MRPDPSELIRGFRRDPTAALAALNAERGIAGSTFIRAAGLPEAAKRVSTEERDALEKLAVRLDAVNEARRAAHRDLEDSRFGISLRWTPIRRVGVYVPHKLASTAVTYLSAMAAAGVPEPLVYLVQDADGDVDPLCAFAAHRYGATTLVGPARLGFLALAFGVPAEHVAPVDLLAGPCGRALNVLKHLACMEGAAVPDMFAGPSAIAVIADETAHWGQIARDLEAQLEHGADSSAHLFVVGAEAFDGWRSTPSPNPRISVEMVGGSVEAARRIDELAPETVEVWTRDATAVARDIRCAGITYVRTSSSLGDYGAIGRGCADPTDRRARAQSGLTPGTFLRAAEVVTRCGDDLSYCDAAALIAEREGLPAHRAAILSSR